MKELLLAGVAGPLDHRLLRCQLDGFSHGCDGRLAQCSDRVFPAHRDHRRLDLDRDGRAAPHARWSDSQPARCSVTTASTASMNCWMSCSIIGVDSDPIARGAIRTPWFTNPRKNFCVTFLLELAFVR